MQHQINDAGKHLEWRPVLGYEGNYEVNEYCQIRTMFRNDKRILKPATRPNWGHKYVSITMNGIRKKKYIHIAGLEAFISPRPVGMEGLHNDGDTENNHISNLRWGTHQENMQDSIKHGTFKNPFGNGSKHILSKLDEKRVVEIKKLLREKKLNHTEIGKLFKVHNSTISYINKGKLWKHVQI